MSKVHQMNVYVANLAVWNVKLHNLHWNVVGEQFPAVHKFTEEIYEDVFTKFDDTAEQLKILGERPAATTKAYAELSTVEEVEAESFSAAEVIAVVKADMAAMKQQAEVIRAAADAEGDFSTVAMMEEHVAGYAKNLWFLSAMQK